MHIFLVQLSTSLRNVLRSNLCRVEPIVSEPSLSSSASDHLLSRASQLEVHKVALAFTLKNNGNFFCMTVLAVL